MFVRVCVCVCLWPSPMAKTALCGSSTWCINDSLSLSLFVNEYFCFVVANIIITITPTNEESVGVNLLQYFEIQINKNLMLFFFKNLLFCLF